MPVSEPIYHLAYDIAQSGFDVWPALLVAWIITALLALEVRYPFIPYISPPFAQKTMRLLVFFIVLSVTIIGTCYSIYSYWSVLQAIKNQRVSKIEGIVTKFRASATIERFCVQDTCFAYPTSLTNVGFRQLSSNGGPIHEGLNVRVIFIGDIITHLETMESR